MLMQTIDTTVIKTSTKVIVHLPIQCLYKKHSMREIFDICCQENLCLFRDISHYCFWVKAYYLPWMHKNPESNDCRFTSYFALFSLLPIFSILLNLV